MDAKISWLSKLLLNFLFLSESGQLSPEPPLAVGKCCISKRLNIKVMYIQLMKLIVISNLEGILHGEGASLFSITLKSAEVRISLIRHICRD